MFSFPQDDVTVFRRSVPSDHKTVFSICCFGCCSGCSTSARLDISTRTSTSDTTFKPTPDVRSFGQLVGHLADSQYFFCSSVAGETKPRSGIEKSKTSKTELVAALKEAVAYCSKTYAGMTDAKGSEMMKMMNYDFAKLTVLSANTAHDYEHYGNMATYMRLKGIIPPTSEKSAGPGQK
jgi:uncharacterized damage-inducible protein DinB